MMIRSLGTALVLTAATMALSGGSCGGNGNGGDGDEFFVQTWSDAAPNTSLAKFIEEAEGEKISITQHTGSMTLSDADLEDIEEIIDFLFFDGDLPDLDLDDATVDATADGSDENPAHFKGTDTGDNDFILRIASTGDLEMFTEDEEPNDDGFALAETVDDDPDVGDDVAVVRFTWPGEDAPDFGELDYMSVVAWVTAAEPAEDATELMVDFGVGHMGLATPEDDMPVDGTAEYDGDFVGIFVDPDFTVEGGGFVGVATGFVDFTADFAEMTVEGGVHEIFIAGIRLDDGAVDGGPSGDILFDDVTISGNTFSGGVTPDNFMEFDEASMGTLDGVFYGPVDPGDVDPGPAEVGAVLTLTDADEESDAFITGVIGATHVD